MNRERKTRTAKKRSKNLFIIYICVAFQTSEKVRSLLGCGSNRYVALSGRGKESGNKKGGSKGWGAVPVTLTWHDNDGRKVFSNTKHTQ